MTFKKDNIVRRVTDDGDGELLRVLKDDEEDNVCTNIVDATGSEDYIRSTNLELVAKSAVELERQKNPQPMEEQTVAIVSFEGAVKREIKAVREALKMCDSVSTFRFEVVASGPVNDGEMKIEYTISGEYGGQAVKGNSVKECVAEFLRRHGWDSTNKPIAISYDGVPF